MISKKNSLVVAHRLVISLKINRRNKELLNQTKIIPVILPSSPITNWQISQGVPELTIFSLQTQQIEVRLVAIKSAYFSPYANTPFHFSQTLPLSLTLFNYCERMIFENNMFFRKKKRRGLVTISGKMLRLTGQIFSCMKRLRECRHSRGTIFSRIYLSSQFTY